MKIRINIPEKFKVKSAVAPYGTTRSIDSRIHSSTRFPVNEECTALTVSPSGRWIIGGFSDGTVRLFDAHSSSKFVNTETMYDFDVALAVGDEECPNGSSSHAARPKIKAGKMVLSKEHQRFGAVACQIHARGVHTALRMDVTVTDDGQWCFAGALRGSMELVAVHTGRIEKGDYDQARQGQQTNLLDLVQVYAHSDAKLRGFGACTRLQQNNKYLLLTGKAIKNIHIWSFEPPRDSQSRPKWQCLYDCPTNGNTIKWLHFRHSCNDNVLQAISKSEGQKLRVWDLSSEDNTATTDAALRPHKPPFYDVVNTESALGVAGSLCICGGTVLFNQMSIVSLDQQSSAYNHTELALPGTDSSAESSRARRQQRGDCKCIVAVATGSGREGRVLLELSDGSVAEYRHDQSVVTTVSSMGRIDDTTIRQLAVGRHGMTVEATYKATTGRGSLRVTLSDVGAAARSPTATLRPHSGGSLQNTTPALDDREVFDVITPRHLVPAATTRATSPPQQQHAMTATTQSAAIVTTTKKRALNYPQPKSAAGIVTTGKKRTHFESMVTPKTTEPSRSDTDSVPMVRRLATATPFKHSRVSQGESIAEKQNDDGILVSPNTEQPDTASIATTTTSGGPRISSNGHFAEKQPHNLIKQPVDKAPQISATKYAKISDGSKKPVTASSNISQPLLANEHIDYQKREVKSSKPFVSTVAAAQRILTSAHNTASRPSNEPSPPVPRKRSDNPNEATIERALSPVPFMCVHDTPSRNPSQSTTIRSPALKSPAPVVKRDPAVTGQMILSACHVKLDELHALKTLVPRKSFWERQAVLAASANNQHRHEAARCSMTAHHSAAHELVRKRVLEAARHTVLSVIDSPILSSLEKAKGFLQCAIQAYQQQNVRENRVLSTRPALVCRAVSNHSHFFL